MNTARKTELVRFLVSLVLVAVIGFQSWMQHSMILLLRQTQQRTMEAIKQRDAALAQRDAMTVTLKAAAAQFTTDAEALSHATKQLKKDQPLLEQCTEQLRKEKP